MDNRLCEASKQDRDASQVIDSDMAPIRMRTVNPASGEPSFIDVPPSGAVYVRAIPGATGVHIALEQNNRVVLRAEVACSPEDALRIDVASESDGSPYVSCVSRDVFVLPKDAPEPRVARIPGGSKALDVVFVVDATTRYCHFDSIVNRWTLASPLLANSEEWSQHVADLARLIEALGSRFMDVRAAVVAFADDPLPHVSARDLIGPGQARLLPGDRQFEACSARTLTDMLTGVPSCPGGDFVDALADALDACAQIHWRDHARKLVIITGDSPGYSLIHPPPTALQLDAHIRDLDVDSAALRLFETWGAEVVTIYHDVPRESGLFDDPVIREALAFARAQYSRLASRPALSVKKSAFAAEAMAELLAGSTFFGMGASIPAADVQ